MGQGCEQKGQATAGRVKGREKKKKDDKQSEGDAKKKASKGLDGKRREETGGAEHGTGKYGTSKRRNEQTRCE